MREYLLVFLVGVAVCFTLTPACRSLALRTGAVARPRSRDVHEEPTPYFGGLAMLGGVAAAYLMASQMPFLSRYNIVTWDSLVVLAAAAVICAVGVIDDLIELNALTKIAGQILAAGILVLGGVRMQWLPWRGGIIALDPAAGILITVFVVFICSNAINLIDGLDGLAAGIVAISASAFFIYAYWLTAEEDLARATTSALVTVVMCGICLGYLPYNFHPAKIFMGDSGAMLLGLLFAASTISLTGQIDPSVLDDRSGLIATYIPLLMPIVALGLPFLDMFVAYTRRTWQGVWWFMADKQHLHHRLLQRGHSHLGAVFMMYAWTALLAYSALLLGIYPSPITVTIVVIAAVSTLAFVIFTGRKTSVQNSEEEPCPKT
ncbi:MAG: undecaprenyl/decaprenyl-phosphate alpha-N-acetylglucosaminyl 1-phosphate transferase [Propionibacteriaceae bacterium]|nr:undecaprenyl/decaprenyl-phosphate alpha-N-acetylglucosaminyl 1-phosphate transferase [Propionibacteriaceae bacterium]